jgi:chemotaxis signal transduction protein
VTVDRRNREILDARARRLATPLRSATGIGTPWLEFALGRERHAVEATLVCGTFRLVEFVPLPGAGPSVVGMSLWRGAFLRVLDLHRLLGGIATGLDDRAMVVALGYGAAKFGVLVGDLAGVRAVPADAILPLEPPAQFVTGVTPDAVHLLDGAALIRTFG